MTRHKKNSLPQGSWESIPVNFQQANQNITNHNITDLIPKSSSPHKQGGFMT